MAGPVLEWGGMGGGQDQNVPLPLDRGGSGRLREDEASSEEMRVSTCDLATLGVQSCKITPMPRYLLSDHIGSALNLAVGQGFLKRPHALVSHLGVAQFQYYEFIQPFEMHQSRISHTGVCQAQRS